MRSDTAMRRRRSGATANNSYHRRAFPQLNVSVVGLGGVEPPTSSSSGFCPGACFPWIALATRERRTAGDRCEPLRADGLWTKRGPDPDGSAAGAHGSGAARLWGEGRTAQPEASARDGACIDGHFDWAACTNGSRSWRRWHDGEVRPEARSVALASEYAQAQVRIWPEEKPGVRHRGDLRKCLFAGEGEPARLIACRPYPPSGDLDLTPIHQGHAPDKVHLVEDQAGGSPRRDQDHFDIDPVTGAGERRNAISPGSGCGQGRKSVDGTMMQ